MFVSHPSRLLSAAMSAVLSGSVLAAPSVMHAQAGALPTIPGYAPATAAAQRQLEQQAIAGPLATRARTHSSSLSREPHVAGTAAQERTRDYVIAQMKAMGLETEIRTYDVWLPHATSVKITRLGRDTVSLDLAEPPIASDPATQLPQYLTANGSTGEGVGQGELVFVNFGLIEDYATLDSMGVSVKGKVVLARYGRSFRGIKAREAEKRGAVAVLIYTDPLDDGFVQGDIYPDGPMRPLRGVQRGSVFNGTGDPLTPGYASKPGAPRLKPEDTPLTKLPVVPISAYNAEQLLSQVRGTDIPRNWQGGMGLRYHVGPGPVQVKVEVVTDAATKGTKQIHNTLGYLRGSEYPDQYIYIGAHRDSWGPGAADNISGTVSVLEAANALSDMAKKGLRPKRTIVFATWDAEEWGLVGSTEYVEDDSLRLKKGAVAYLNQDVSAQGSQFGGGGSPSMRAILRDIVKSVPDPKGRGSVYQAWRLTSGTRVDSLEPGMGDPGGGSDFAGFYNHFGIPTADWGFGGPAGTYHSAYDTFAWMERFGDPGFLYHAAAGRIGAAMALRLANAEVLPYDYAEFARTMLRYIAPVERGMTQKGWSTAQVATLTAAINKLNQAANEFATARDATLAKGVAKEQKEAANAALLSVERGFARDAGLKSRPWYRTLIYAADVDNGYSSMVFPGVNEAIRYGTEAETNAEIADLVKRFDAASAAMLRARTALTTAPSAPTRR
ncbi:glutamate carboxypeptidase II [Gemmatimonas aurantiaca T-27]|uniref:Glutamate carboxypeptidase II n=1 Tax=Gemmatimonas aurantiaca (strain DSM 14586 / JCM 11422 / NBRC 100505 / T-27) TaxID=379066 RepID=C1A4P5_GEMAT|nr:M20/M25/M40 family metallo-hydrolase [Gemmatimonas aurantiaca]BAH37205.1 glutamate carboxypeptidase II [Gemmatimonas aurantiaca T-27]